MKHLIVAMVSLSFLGCFDFESAFQQYCDSGGCGDGSSTGGGGGSAGGGGGSTGDGGGNAGGGIGVVGGGSGGGSAEDGGKPDSGTPDSGVTQVESCDASLCLASKFLASTSALWSVKAASPNDVWASGNSATWAHWDGLSWTSGRLPENLAQWRLYAVDVSPSYVFLAGEEGIFRKARDGGDWALDHSIDSSTEVVNGFWANTDEEQFATGYLHWILRGNGSHWVDELRMPSAPSGTTGDLSDLDGVPGHVYAVGSYDNDQAIVWRRLDAGVWAEEPIPVTSALEKVSVASSTSVWAVGNEGVVLERQADAGWRQHNFPTTIDFETVWASSATDAWVGGWGGKLWHWNGQSWSQVNPPGLTADFDIFDISGVGTTDLFVAATFDTHIGSYGDQFDGGHVFHYRRR